MQLGPFDRHHVVDRDDARAGHAARKQVVRAVEDVNALERRVPAWPHQRPRRVGSGPHRHVFRVRGGRQRPARQSMRPEEKRVRRRRSRKAIHERLHVDADAARFLAHVPRVDRYPHVGASCYSR